MHAWGKGNVDRREPITQTKITKTPFHMQIIAPDLQSAVQIGLRRNKPLRGHPDTVPANDIVCTIEFRTANLFESVQILAARTIEPEKKLLGREGDLRYRAGSIHRGRTIYPTGDTRRVLLPQA